MLHKRKENPTTKIMLFGTFDFLHKGHVHFFRQARKLARNPYIIVSVARDVNVQKIKGKKPLYNQEQRIKEVIKNSLVDKVILGGLHNHLLHILKERPNIIALGYDQIAYTKGLKKELAAKGLDVRVIRLLPHKQHVYKSSLLKKTMV